jgi:hypothetical protein
MRRTLTTVINEAAIMRRQVDPIFARQAIGRRSANPRDRVGQRPSRRTGVSRLYDQVTITT